MAHAHIVIDIGHRRPGRETGAACDLGEETALVRQYVDAMWRRLSVYQSVSAEVWGRTPAEYQVRHQRACDLAALRSADRLVYIQCHLNAGGGNYALIGHDHRSKAGEALARSWWAHARHAGYWPGVKRGVAVAATPGDWTRAIHYCLKGIYPGPRNICGLLIEPAFLDHAPHRASLTPEGLAEMGRKLGVALAAALQETR